MAKKIMNILLLSVLCVGHAKSDYLDEYGFSRESHQFSIADYEVSPLELRLATQEALCNRNWKPVEVMKSRIVSVYKGRYIEIVFDDDELVIMRELPKNIGKAFSKSWLPNLEQSIVEQINHMHNVNKIKNFSY